jgi:predicted DNA-binding transcriptional regulator YafY
LFRDPGDNERVWDTSARLLRLLSLLQGARERSGADLASRLEVTTRTVRKDVDRLRSLGYPVEATPGPAGGYRLGAGADLPPLLLDDEEAVAVAVGLRSAASGSVVGIEDASLRALTKLDQVLPSRLRYRLSALERFTVAVPAAGDAPRVPAELLTTLVAACRDRERLRFDYTTHTGAPSRRDVEPYQLVTWGRRWYLVGYDVERAGWRTFRVDRLRPRTPNGPRFAPRPLPAEDLAEYVARQVGTATWRYRAHVLVHAPAAAVADRLPPAVEVSAVDEHRCRILVGADNLTLVAVWLAALDEDFEVLDPPELRAELHRLGQRYLRAARPGNPGASDR